ncbi:MAG: hypothetical protein ACFCVH_20420 [Alphaproteobacteria bacterium]
MSDALSISFEPAFAWPILGVLAIAAVLVCSIGIWRNARGAWWRVAGAGLLLLALANPTLIEEQRSPLDDIALIVIDESTSQRVAGREDLTRETADAIEAELRAQPGLDVRVARVDSAGAGSTDQGTRLMSAVEVALADAPRSRLAGVIALTDGQVHDVPSGDALGLTPGPFHVLLTGRPDERDRRIEIVEASGFGLVGREQAITVRIDDPGAEGEIAELSIRYGGGEAETMPAIVGQPFDITVGVDHAGSNVYEIEVEPGESELTLINNRVVAEINGVRDRLRVLLVSGEPHAGERMWRDLLKSDPSVDLIHFTILRPPEKHDNTPVTELSLISFPVRELFEIQIDEFDLIIFDRYRRRGVLPPAYLENIANYVRNGGAFLEAVGPTFATPLSLYNTPLGPVLPGAPTGLVMEEGFLPELTDVGRRHPVTSILQSFEDADGVPSWGRWFRIIDTERTSGDIVMSDQTGRPLLILDRVGEGRIAQIMSDQIWLWARGYEGGGPYQELLRRIAHWLMREPALEEDALRADVQGDQITIERQSLEDSDAPVEVTGPSGSTEQVTLGEPDDHGIARGTLRVDEPGLYRLGDGTRVALAAVGGVNPVELADVRATDALLRPVADATGGGLYWLAEDGTPDIRMVAAGRSTAGSRWLGLRANGDFVVTGVRDIPLMPAALALALIVAAMMIAWRREGR